MNSRQTPLKSLRPCSQAPRSFSRKGRTEQLWQKGEPLSLAQVGQEEGKGCVGHNKKVQVRGHRKGEEADPDPTKREPVLLHMNPSQARCQPTTQLSGPCCLLSIPLPHSKATSYSGSASSLHFTFPAESFLPRSPLSPVQTDTARPGKEGAGQLGRVPKPTPRPLSPRQALHPPAAYIHQAVAPRPHRRARNLGKCSGRCPPLKAEGQKE